MSDDFFKVIARELGSGHRDEGLWTRAFAECDGDEAKTKAMYIRLRHAALAAGANAAAGHQEPPSAAPANPASAPSRIPAAAAPPPAAKPIDEMTRLRWELRSALTQAGKSSFYSVLGLPVDASDDQVAQVVSAFVSRGNAGETLSPEVRYAMEALGAPDKREAYDRRLLQTLKAPPVASPQTGFDPDDASGSVFLSWWASRKVTVLIGIGGTLLAGMLALGFFRGGTERELVQGVVANDREAIRVIGNNDAYRAETERKTLDGLVENQSTAIGHAARIVDEEQARQRQEMEYRQQDRNANRDMERERREEAQRQAQLDREEREKRRAEEQQARIEAANARRDQEYKRQKCAEARRLQNGNYEDCN